MAAGNRTDRSVNAGASRSLKAATWTVLVHFLVLLALRVTPVGPGAPAVTYVEVSVATEEEMEEFQEWQESQPDFAGLLDDLTYESV